MSFECSRYRSRLEPRSSCVIDICFYAAQKQAWMARRAIGTDEISGRRTVLSVTKVTGLQGRRCSQQRRTFSMKFRDLHAGTSRAAPRDFDDCCLSTKPEARMSVGQGIQNVSQGQARSRRQDPRPLFCPRRLVRNKTVRGAVGKRAKRSHFACSEMTDLAQMTAGPGVRRECQSAKGSQT